MKVFLSAVLLFLLSPDCCYSQQFSLKNRAFISSFKSQTFNLKELKPAATPYWQLIAGRCTDTKIDDSDTLCKRIIDSVKCEYIHESVMACYKDSIEILRKQIAYYECLKNNNCCSSNTSPCYLLRPAARDWSYPTAIDIAEIFDAEVQNEHYNYAYKVDYLYASSTKFAAIAPMLNYCITKGWATWCPPGYCDWLIVSNKKGKTSIINNNRKLIEFLGRVDNVNKAFLLICAMNFGDSQSYPTDGAELKFTKVGTTFYLIQKLRLSDCPVRNFLCLISVQANGTVKIIDKVQVGRDGGCI